MLIILILKRTLFQKYFTAHILFALCFVYSPQSLGQNTDDDMHQSDVFDQVNHTIGQLQAMTWGPDVVTGLSRLGSITCHYNQELGVQVFQTAYTVAAEIEFNLNNEQSLYTLASLVSNASQCDSSLRNHVLVSESSQSALSARADLYSAMDTVRDEPDKAISFARNTASKLPYLDRYQQLAFLETLWSIRDKNTTEANAIFRIALFNSVLNGTDSDLFTLGNYIFGPESVMPNAIAEVGLSNGLFAYRFATVRPNVSNDLVDYYIKMATDKFMTRGLQVDQNFGSFALATQLQSWSKSNDPKHLALLDELLTSNANSMTSTPDQLSTIQKRLIPRSLNDHKRRLESQLESAIDNHTKSTISFRLCVINILRGDFTEAEELVDNIIPSLHQPLLDTIAFKRTIMDVVDGDLIDAIHQVVSLSDDLYRVFAALSLSTAYWSIFQDSSIDSNSDSGATRDDLYKTLQVAVTATENVPDHLRAQVRIVVANVLERCGEDLAALRMLEMAVQEMNTASINEDINESVLDVRYYSGSQFVATVKADELEHSFDLVPPNLRDIDFSDLVTRLAALPHTDLDQLEYMVSSIVHRPFRIDGLISIVAGRLDRAFNVSGERVRGK